MAKTVTTIPASISKFTKNPINKLKKRKVAGYARVSTDHEDQVSSYDAQVDYYTNYIKSRDDWQFVRLYTDEGISATNTKKREGFNTMVRDAISGKIDLIVTKSVSRFARNTVDSLSTIRKLKEHGCEVYFEKESIWTFDSKGELLITIMSSLAQEESRSISENCTWGQRKRFKDGKVTVPFKRFLGYDKGEDGNLVINEKEAKIVKKIYALFLKGYSPFGIAKILTEEGVKTPGGKNKWGQSTVKSILTNEKYKGDALLQKVFTVDYLTKQKKVNEGEVPQYYVKNNHEAIIKPETFDRVQHEFQIRCSKRSRLSSVSIFSSKIICGDCSSLYGSKVWHSNSKYKRTVWQCNAKFKNSCETIHLTEDEVKDIFVKAVNKLAHQKKGVIKVHKEMKDILFSTDELERKQVELENELNVVAGLIDNIIKENARTVKNQDEYQKNYAELVLRFENTKMELDKLVKEITERTCKKDLVSTFLKSLEKQELIESFDIELWHSLVESITIYKNGDKKVKFLDGTEVEL